MNEAAPQRRGLRPLRALLLGALLVWVLTLVFCSLGPSRSDSLGGVGGLKAIHNSQVLFSEGDEDGDGRPNFASLEQLESAGLRLPLQPYAYSLSLPADPCSGWCATATPQLDGLRHLYTDHSGAIYSSPEPILVSTPWSGELPQGLTRFGP